MSKATGSSMLILGAAIVGASIVGASVIGMVAGTVAAGGMVAGWVDRVIARVTAHEGGFASLNLNRDNAGLSFGILQWAQAPKSLGKLLAAMNAADPTAFARIFGPTSSALLAATATGSLAPVPAVYPNGTSAGPVVLWAEPWVARFKAAGNYRPFQAVQTALAKGGEYFQGALKVAQILNTRTERSMTLFLDTAVQQGPASAIQAADRTVAALNDTDGDVRVPYGQLLQRYAAIAASPYRRTTAPTAPYGNPRLSWKAVGDEWHLFAGAVDLYADVTRRRAEILNDPTLGDAPVTLASA